MHQPEQQRAPQDARNGGAGRRAPAGQVLLIDADDTLWENNIYFERAIASFIGYLNHRTYSPDEVRRHLNRHELATIREHGYGVKSFRRSLLSCMEELGEQPVTEAMHRQVLGFTEAIVNGEMEIIAGVAETLLHLKGRHTVWLATKGNPEEQHGKIERSKLAEHFHGVEVMAEKDEASYRELAERHGWAPERTWMIGNSPKSDINPALAAGLGAVYIPHPHTWVLERTALAREPDGIRFVQLERFAALAEIF